MALPPAPATLRCEMAVTSKTIAVLGAGSAGLTAATTAAKLDARVVLFMGPDPDRASLCVNRGCMPSKGMFEALDVVHRARRRMGPRAGPLDPDSLLRSVIDWKDREIARFRAYRQRTIRRYAGDDFLLVRHPARFVDPHTLEAAGERYEADAIVIATGSTPIYPAIDGLEELAEAVWTNEEILTTRSVPESLLVIGAGAIGLEFSLRFARLGCRVTVVSHTSILPRFPARFGHRITEIYEREGIRMLPERSVTRIGRDVEGWFVCDTEGGNGAEPLVAQKVLLAAGRRPMFDGLDLEAAGVEPAADGSLEVGEDTRIAGHDHLFVAGDAGGRRMVVHLAHIEAGIAAENAAADGDRTWEKKANLQVVFSDPEFAFAGVSADDAREQGRSVATARKESRLVGKLHLAGDDLGFGELVADAEEHTVIGAALLCDDAANLIHLPAYLIEHDQTVHEAARGEYYHPTRIEIVTSMIDDLCRQLGGRPFCRAPE